MIVNKDHQPIIVANNGRSSVKIWLEKILSVVLTFALWYILISSIIDKLFITNLDRTILTFAVLGIALALIILIGGMWQFYNWTLYHGKDRRQEFPRQSLEELGQLYGISGENMYKLQEIQSAAVIRFEDGRYYYCMKNHDPIEISALREESESSDKPSDKSSSK